MQGQLTPDEGQRTRLTAEALGNLLNPLWTPGTFSIDDDDLAFCTASLLGKLCNDSHGMRKLGFAASCSLVSFSLLKG